jgi:hypothetical protein
VTAPPKSGSATTIVLLTLCAGQFLMTLDSVVMNVSIATVAKSAGGSPRNQLRRRYP